MVWHLDRNLRNTRGKYNKSVIPWFNKKQRQTKVFSLNLKSSHVSTETTSDEALVNGRCVNWMVRCVAQVLCQLHFHVSYKSTLWLYTLWKKCSHQRKPHSREKIFTESSERYYTQANLLIRWRIQLINTCNQWLTFLKIAHTNYQQTFGSSRVNHVVVFQYNVGLRRQLDSCVAGIFISM